MNNSDHDNSAREVVFSRQNGWIPQVIRENGALYVELGAGATANHEPRTFSFPITEAHLEVIKSDLKRHLLVWSAILPLCDAAGTKGPLDEEAAVALLDPILFGSESEVEAFMKTIKWYNGQLISRHANPELLDNGEIFAALETITEASDPSLAAEYSANRQRAKRGVVPAPLDTAILKYTNQYLHGAGLASRNPDAVDPELLPEVLKVIAVGEEASEGMEFTTDAKDPLGRKQEWKLMQERIENAVHEHYPMLVSDSLSTVSYLLCSEASAKARRNAA